MNYIIKNKLIALITPKQIVTNIFSAYTSMVKSIQQLFPGDSQKQMDNIAFIVANLATATRFINIDATNVFSSEHFKLDDITSIITNTFKFPANERPNFNEYFMNIALMVSMRSSCYGRKTGALIVSGHNIVSAGYNGAPHGKNSCMHEGTCTKEALRHAKLFELHLQQKQLEKEDISRIIQISNEHCPSPCAERDALSRLPAIQEGSELNAYCTLFPCLQCATALSKVPKLNKVYYAEDYKSSTGTTENNQKARDILEKAGIDVIPIKFTMKSFSHLIYELVHPQGLSRARQKTFEALPSKIRNDLGL